MAARVPTEEEFNNWESPANTLDDLPHRLDPSTNQRWVMTRLQGGMIRAAARSAQKNHEPSRSITLVAPRYWQMWSEYGEDDFWEMGDAIFVETGAGGYGSVEATYRFFDVRFDPSSFDGKSKAPSPDVFDTAPVSTPQIAALAAPAPTPLPEDPTPDDRTNLTAPEARRFCEWLISFEPDAKMRDAHRRAVGFYHDRKVPRDWFWDIFRTIQGPKSPGKQPNKRN